MASGRRLRQLCTWAAVARMALDAPVVSGVRLNGGAGGSSSGLAKIGSKVGRDGRFTLVERLKTWRLGGETAPGPSEGMDFIARGSFGEAYRSWDDNLGKHIITKLFYRMEPREGDDGDLQDVHYINAMTATETEKSMLEAEEWACKQVQFIHKQADRYGRRHPGADHICACYEVDLYEGLVSMEDCGQELNEWQPASEEERAQGANKVAKSMLQALDLMNEADRPHVYIHHDLKLSNVAFTLGRDGLPDVKLIDFGALRLTDYDRDLVTGCIFNLDYSPPELRHVNWHRPPCSVGDYEWTYDVFGVGAIYATLLTEQRTEYDTEKFQWVSMARKSKHKVALDVAMLAGSLTTWYWARPKPWPAVLSNVLSPEGFSLSTYKGTWHMASNGQGWRTYRLSKISAGPNAGGSGAAAAEYELVVLSDRVRKGSARLGQDSCKHRLRVDHKQWATTWSNDYLCCQVELEYETTKRKLHFWEEAINVTLSVTLCPVSFWALRFEESPVSKPPREYLDQPRVFRRLTASQKEKNAEDKFRRIREEETSGGFCCH